MIEVYAFRWVPPFAQGVVRDVRVRWALEEAGRPYEERLIGPEDRKSASYRELQPYGQVPAYREGEGSDALELFESGAIVLHIAETSEALMPTEPRQRARASAWVISALNSVEPFLASLVELEMNGQEEWAKLRRPTLTQAVERRLDAVSAWLGDREYLEERFTVGDLVMTTTLRMLRSTDVLSRMPRLDAYRKRCESRPAFERALAAHMAPFAKHAPPSA